MSMEMQMQQTQEIPSAPQKISEWLTKNVSSHDIAVFEGAKEDFEKATGKEFISKAYARSASGIRQEIRNRGLGGHYNGNEPGVAGWDLAEALARKYTDFTGAALFGRGGRYRAAVDALRKAGL